MGRTEGTATVGVGPTEAGTEPTSRAVAAMVPKIASNSDQTARSHRSWEVGTQRIAMPHAMPTLGRATLLSSARDRKVGEEWGGGDRAYTANYA